MYVDYHSHILPKMDDGAKDEETSVEMIKMLKNQGVDTIVSTSHFYAHRESIESFMQRRRISFERLMSAEPAVKNIILGAEVAIERGIAEKKGIENLRMGDSRYILLELPYAAYSGWMEEEITNIQLGFGLTPVIAHINRYMKLYSSSQLDYILNLSGVILQINNEVFHSHSETRFALKLIKQGYPVVFGSDTHNMDERKPNFDIFEKVLKKKLKRDFEGFTEEYCSLIRKR